MPLEIQVCHCHSLFTYVFKRALSSSSPLQVSHHPPAAAHHVISERGWNLRQEITVASKFRGKYLSIMPLGKTEEISGFRNCKRHNVFATGVSNYCGLMCYLWFDVIQFT